MFTFQINSSFKNDISKRTKLFFTFQIDSLFVCFVWATAHRSLESTQGLWPNYGSSHSVALLRPSGPRANFLSLILGSILACPLPLRTAQAARRCNRRRSTGHGQRAGGNLHAVVPLYRQQPAAASQPARGAAFSPAKSKASGSTAARCERATPPAAAAQPAPAPPKRLPSAGGATGAQAAPLGRGGGGLKPPA